MSITRREFLKAVGAVVASASLASTPGLAKECVFCGRARDGSDDCKSCGAPPKLAEQVEPLEPRPVDVTSLNARAGDQIKVRIGDVTYYVLHRQRLAEGTPVSLEVSGPTTNSVFWGED